MKRTTIMLGVSIAFGVIGCEHLHSQEQPRISRTDVLTTGMAGMEGREAHMWVADIDPGATTAAHAHPTPRFVYVLEGTVRVEVDGQAARTYRAGEGFEEPPGVVHIFRNESSTEPARALGFQIAETGQPLQVIYPCGCDRPSGQSLDERMAYAAHVLRARVVRTELLTAEVALAEGQDGESIKAQVEILEVFKGTPALLDGVYTAPNRDFCGVPLTVDREYVFFLSESGRTSLCDGTMQLRGDIFDSGFFGEQSGP